MRESLLLDAGHFRYSSLSCFAPELVGIETAFKEYECCMRGLEKTIGNKILFFMYIPLPMAKRSLTKLALLLRLLVGRPTHKWIIIGLHQYSSRWWNGIVSISLHAGCSDLLEALRECFWCSDLITSSVYCCQCVNVRRKLNPWQKFALTTCSTVMI